MNSKKFESFSVFFLADYKNQIKEEKNHVIDPTNTKYKQSAKKREVNINNLLRKEEVRRE
jgi:hypothetical protein